MVCDFCAHPRSKKSQVQDSRVKIQASGMMSAENRSNEEGSDLAKTIFQAAVVDIWKLLLKAFNFRSVFLL